MNFETFTSKLAEDHRTESLDIHLCLTLFDVLRPFLQESQAFAAHPDPVINTLVQAAATNPNVMADLDTDIVRKIQAIKTLRDSQSALTGVTPGLKDCKDAVDFICETLDIQRLRKKLMG